MPKTTAARRSSTGVAPQTPDLYRPDARRPARAKEHVLSKAEHIVPHTHAWAQVVFAAAGVVRVVAQHGTYLVPPSRAVWIPPGVEHAVSVLEDTRMRTVYLHQAAGCCGPFTAQEQPATGEGAWRQCRVVEVSDLLRSLVMSLDITPDGQPVQADVPAREQLIVPLLMDELRRAPALSLGVRLPQDKRLRTLCEAMIEAPARHATLQAWAQDTGASARTLARLFRDELGTSFGQWRRQVLLAQALALGARGRPVSWIAGELGYASASAFTAMVRRTMGEPPRRLLSQSAATRRVSA